MRRTSIEKESISIRNIIIIVFIALLIATVGVISYIVFSNWFSSAKDTVEKISEDMNDEVEREKYFVDVLSTHMEGQVYSLQLTM